MRSVLLAPLFAVAASAMSIARVGPAAYVVPDNASPAVQQQVVDYSSHAHAHAHARRGAGHGSRLRKVRRRATKRCKAKHTSSDAAGPSASSHSSEGSSTSSTGSANHTDPSETSSSSYAHPTESSWESSSSSDWAAPTDSSSTDWAAPTDSSSSTGWDESATSTSAAEPAPTDGGSNNSTGSGGGGSPTDSSHLMPLGRGMASWSTCPYSNSHMSFDEALLPLQAGKLPSSASAPDGSNAFIQVYPAGGIGGSSGYSFYTSGDKASVAIQSANELVFSFSVYFTEDFDFVKGGKLPGVYGGTSYEAAKSCSGGRQSDECFSSRLMWRTDGAGEIYNYLPPSINQGGDYCSTAPYSHCNAQYGDSIGRGCFAFNKGQWVTVAQRVKLNTPGQSDGEQELFVNGASVLTVRNLQQRTQASTTFYGVMAQSFFGGSTSDFAPPSDQTAYFKDWTLSILN